jgi:hypothetical protein
MPDRGLLTPRGIKAGPLTAGGSPVTFEDARWAQLTYEVSQAAALARLPGDANRPVPCYGRLMILDARSSSVGPVRIATLSVGGRYRMLPKNVLVDAIVDGDAAGLSGALGGPYRAGTVSLERDGARLVATVADASGPLATLTLPALYAVDPSMIRWDPLLGFVDAGDAIQLVEYTPAITATEAFLSKHATLETSPALARNNVWRGLRNLNTISACYETGSFAVSAPQVQQTL